MTKTKTDLEVSGVVEHTILFRNSSDSMGIVKIKDGAGAQHAVLCVVVGIEAGDFIEVVGTEHEHPTHGMRIRAKTVKVSLPKDQASLSLWLARHFDIQPFVVRNLVEDWFTQQLPTVADPDKVLFLFFQGLYENNPVCRSYFEKHGVLHVYPGVSVYVQRTLVIEELLTLGLDTKEAHSLFRTRGLDAPRELREDPYTAYYYIENMSFSKVDKIYLAQRSRSPNDEKRLRAVCLHEIKDRADEGHTAMYYDDFLDYMSEKYETLSAQRFIHCLDALMPEFITLYGSPQMLQLVTHARYEAGVAEFIVGGKVLTQPPGHEGFDDDE